jgi:hypothetical protein
MVVHEVELSVDEIVFDVLVVVWYVEIDVVDVEVVVLAVTD